jgi:hypothetical protein
MLTAVPRCAPHRMTAMKTLTALLLALCCALPGGALAQAASSPADPKRFDGTWDVTIVCPAVQAGNRQLRPVLRQMVAVVVNGQLAATKGPDDEPGSLYLHGKVDADGNAVLEMDGVVKNPRQVLKDDAQVGDKITWHILAQFDEQRGSGKRMDARPCDLKFVRKPD